jgi:hypothetical protein
MPPITTSKYIRPSAVTVGGLNKAKIIIIKILKLHLVMLKMLAVVLIK